MTSKNDEQDRRLNDHENRINTLEETDVCVVGEVDFIREKNVTVGAYGKFDVRHNEVPEVGLKITIGLGESWQERETKNIEKRIKALEEKLEMIGAEPKMEKTENGWSISINEDKMTKVVNKF